MGAHGIGDALAAPSTRSTAVAFLDAVRKDPLFEVVGYDRLIYQEGFSLYASRPDKAWSLTDCISFAVMTAKGLSEALTADHHFQQAGFRPVF
jgi:uncharacterized protein